MQAMRQDSAPLRVDASKAAELMGVNERTMRRHAASGKLPAETVASATGGGSAGAAYQIPVESLPLTAQLKYYAELARPEINIQKADIERYQRKFGQVGIEDLFRRQQAVLTVIGIRKAGLGGVTAAIAEVAAQYGVSDRTLRRWEVEYAEAGLAGIMDAVEYSNKGKPRTLCAWAQITLVAGICDNRKKPQELVFERLRQRAAELGDDACSMCPFCDWSDERAQLNPEQLPLFPSCDQAQGRMIVANNRHAVNRYLKTVPKQLKIYGQYGDRAWKAQCMHKTKRLPPEKINEVWFGDHHEFDLMVLTEKGQIVRPWLTAWMDATTGDLNGCVLTLNPNSDTIAEGLRRATLPTLGSDAYGLPVAIYMDNGKDYLAHRFLGDHETEYELGKLNADLWDKRSLVEGLGIRVHRAQPLTPWPKTIERAFGTLERWIRECPGWCGGSPGERPQDNELILRRLVKNGKLMTFETFAKVFFEKILPAYRAFKGEDGISPAEIYRKAEWARKDFPDNETMSILQMMRKDRKVAPQGIRLNNTLYWHPALWDYVGEEVTVGYNRGPNLSITVRKDGSFICEAPALEMLRLIETDQDKLARHMEEQRAQQKKVSTRLAYIRQATKKTNVEMYAEEIDEQRTRATATMVSMEAHRITADKKAVVAAARRSRQEAQAGEDAARQMMIRLGKNAARNA